jgi:hypothetical protein
MPIPTAVQGLPNPLADLARAEHIEVGKGRLAAAGFQDRFF